LSCGYSCSDLGIQIVEVAQVGASAARLQRLSAAPCRAPGQVAGAHVNARLRNTATRGPRR